MQQAPPFSSIISMHSGTVLAADPPPASLTVDEEARAFASFVGVAHFGGAKPKPVGVVPDSEGGEEEGAGNDKSEGTEVEGEGNGDGEAPSEENTEDEGKESAADGDEGANSDALEDGGAAHPQGVSNGISRAGVLEALRDLDIRLCEDLFREHVEPVFRERGLLLEDDRLDLDGYIDLCRRVYAPAHKYGARLRKACGRCDEEIVKDLLARGCNPLGTDGGGFSALHSAAQFGHVSIIDMLLSFAEDPPEAFGARIEALVAAADAAAGATKDVDAETLGTEVEEQTSEGGESSHASLPPTQIEAKEADEGVADEASTVAIPPPPNFYVVNRSYEQVLLEARDNSGWTPLMVASACGKVDAVTRLIKANADVTASSTDAKLGPIGRTALHWACAKGRAAVVPLLLASPTVDVNCADGSGWTPLHCAVFHGHVTVAVLLIKKFRAQEELEDFIGKKPLDYADSEMKLAILEALSPSKRRQSQQLGGNTRE
jgi:ankyrin repeat protein